MTEPINGERMAAREAGGPLPAAPPRGILYVQYTLPAGSALAYRLARTATVAAGGAATGAAALAAASAFILLLPYVFGGGLLQLIQAAILLAGIFAAIISFSAIPISFAEMGRDAELAITSDALLRFDEVHSSAEISLSDVNEIRVVQSPFGAIFGYGTVQVFTIGNREPAILIEGVPEPLSMKKKLEAIINNELGLRSKLQ